MVMWHALTRQVFLRGQGASVSREFRMTRQMWSYPRQKFCESHGFLSSFQTHRWAKVTYSDLNAGM